MSTTVFEKVGNVLTVKPVGRMDTATSPVLEQELESQIDGVQEIVMDFADVEYISSGGMRVLLAVEQQLEEKNGSLRQQETLFIAPIMAGDKLPSIVSDIRSIVYIYLN